MNLIAAAILDEGYFYLEPYLLFIISIRIFYFTLIETTYVILNRSWAEFLFYIQKVMGIKKSVIMPIYANKKQKILFKHINVHLHMNLHFCL